MNPNEIVVKNYGISFGINGTIFILLNIFFILFLLVLIIKEKKNFTFRYLGYWLIFIGGIANLVERIILGYVRDYWNFFYLGLYNNINDWIIGIGVIFCLIDLLWKKSK